MFKSRHNVLGLRHRTATLPSMAPFEGFKYFPVSSHDIRRDIYVTSVGRLTYAPAAAYPVAGHPDGYALNWQRGRILGDFAVVLIEQGAGELETRASGRIAWKTGEVLLLPPGVWHRYRPEVKTGWTERWLCLNGDFLFRLRAKGVFPPQPLLRALPDTRDFVAAWERLRRAAADRNALFIAACGLQVLAVALEGAERGQPGASYDATEDPIVDKALEFIWYNSHRSLPVAAVAHHVGVNRRTLERHFATVQPRNVAKEIEWARLQRARQMLGETSMSIKEVGFAAGFAGPARLIRVFKNQLGVTPVAYRDSIRAHTKK